MLVEPVRLLWGDLLAVPALGLWRARGAVLERAEVGVGELPVVLRAGGRAGTPRRAAEHGNGESSENHHGRGAHREWYSHGRFGGLHHQPVVPQHRPPSQDPVSVNSTSYFGTRSTFSSPSDL